MPAALPFILMGLLLAVLGYLIRFRRWSWLVSGYNTSSRATKARYDVPKLTRGVGNFAFLLAGLQVLAGLGALAGLAWVPVATMVALVVSAVAFIIFANTGGRYLKKR